MKEQRRTREARVLLLCWLLGHSFRSPRHESVVGYALKHVETLNQGASPMPPFV